MNQMIIKSTILRINKKIWIQLICKTMKKNKNNNAKIIHVHKKNIKINILRILFIE